MEYIRMDITPVPVMVIAVALEPAVVVFREEAGRANFSVEAEGGGSNTHDSALLNIQNLQITCCIGREK